MQELSNYDPYSIKQIQFNVNKVTKYTTIKSILASLAIFFIAIFLNIKSISNLWCPRSQLKIQSFENINHQALEAFPICVMAVSVGEPLPSQINAYQLFPNLTIVSQIPLTNAYNSNEKILALASGREFVCFQIGGYYLNPFYRIRVITSGFPDIYLKTTEYSQVIYQDTYQMLKISPSEHIDNQTTQFSVGINAKRLKAVIYDKLLPNSDPQILYNIQPNNIEMFFDSVSTLGNPQTTTIDLLSPAKYNSLLQVSQYYITRQDIATIISKFLAWFSVLLIIFQMIISPIVDWSYKMSLAKQIYQNQTLNRMETSVTSFFKFLTTKIFCKSIFQEGLLHSIFESLDKDMDILHIIKRQEIMRKLIRQNQDMETINHQNFFRLEQEKSELSLQNDQDGLTYDNIQLLVGSQNNQEADQSQLNQKNLCLNSSKVKFTVEEDKQQKKTGCCFGIIESFDIGQTSISLITNKGKGYGNKWNTILTAVAVLGMLAFLILAGFLTIKTTNSFKVVSNSYSGQQAQYVITPDDLIVRMRRFSPADRFFLNLVVADQNYRIIENITLLTGSSCDGYRNALNQTGTGWLCLSKNITLKNNGRGSSQKIHIYPTFFTSLRFTFASIQFALKTSTINQQLFRFDQTIKYDTTRWNSANYQTTNVQLLTHKKPNGQENSIVAYLKSLKLRLASTSPTIVGQAGVTINLMPSVIVIQQTQNTIWDLIQNSWGVVILCFAMLLSKITNFINARERKKITSIEQSQGRSDIVSILTTQDKLQNSAFRNQLQSIGYFYKSRLPSEDLKKL